MEKLTDIYINLDENLDIKKDYIKKNIKTNSRKQNSTNDILCNLKNLNLTGKKKIKLEKNKTKNGDSLLKDKRLKDIDLIHKISFFKKIKLSLKGRLTLTGKPISVFKNRTFISKGFFKKGTLILLILIFIGFLDKIIVENRINAGYKKIISIKNNSGNIDFIQKTINDAKVDFFIGNLLFKPFLLIPNENIKNGYFILQGGKELTNLIDESIYLYISTKKFIDSTNGIENIKFTNLLSNIKKDFSNITGLLYNTIVSYDKITELSDQSLNKQLSEAKYNMKSAYKFLNIIDKDFEIFLGLLGNDSEKKYLILFQNNDEIRATGGFIGSLATVTLKNGQITSFIKDDVYAYEWDINKSYKKRIPAPEGLNKITDHFGLRDSNYFPSFKDSSNSIQFFLEKINKEVDGIIYINQNTILDLLKLTGGIEFKELGETITEENFSLIISTLVEAQSFKVGTLGTPKQVLFDFTKLFIAKLKEDKDYFAYIDVLIKNIKSRDLVIYSFNSDENNLLWRLGLNGEVNFGDSLDFAYPVYTSIGGNKSDRYMETKYKKNITLNNDCSINTNLSINKTHFFSKFEEEKVNNLLDNHPIKDKSRKDIINIQGKGANISYTRVLLPKNAIVKNKKGMNIKKENNLTIVDFYITTRVLESKAYNIKYTLPNVECKPYSYKLYKQPGIRKFNLELTDSGDFFRELNIEGDYYYKQ